MLIDIAYLIILVLATFKGYRKGFIVAVFSFTAIFVGLAAALKLSATVAVWLQKSTHIAERLLPVLAFAIVLIGVAFVARLAASAIEKIVNIAMLGFVNKIGGVFLYALLYTLIFSIILFFATRISLLKHQVIEASYVYPFIEPLGPKSINAFSQILPYFKNMFQQLENFFNTAAHHNK